MADNGARDVNTLAKHYAEACKAHNKERQRALCWEIYPHAVRLATDHWNGDEQKEYWDELAPDEDRLVHKKKWQEFPEFFINVINHYDPERFAFTTYFIKALDNRSKMSYRHVACPMRHGDIGLKPLDGTELHVKTKTKSPVMHTVLERECAQEMRRIFTALNKSEPQASVMLLAQVVGKMDYNGIGGLFGGANKNAVRMSLARIKNTWKEQTRCLLDTYGDAIYLSALEQVLTGFWLEHPKGKKQFPLFLQPDCDSRMTPAYMVSSQCGNGMRERS